MNESTSSAASPNSTAPPSALAKVARTVAEGFALIVFAQTLSVILTLLGAKFFLQSQAQSQGVDQMMSKNLALFIVLAVVVAPLMEELIFRGIPNLAMRLTTKPETQARRVVWLVFGLASSLLFGAMHGMKNNGAGGAIAFQTLPLPQIVVGLWAWHVATLRGLRYSMLLHATFNGIAVALAFLALALGQKM